MLRKTLSFVHVGLAVLCVVLCFDWMKTEDALYPFAGILLFGGMAISVWTGSRWVLLPGCLLMLLSLAMFVMFAAAFVWPERIQNLAIGLALALGFLELISVVSTLKSKSPVVSRPSSAGDDPDSLSKS